MLTNNEIEQIANLHISCIDEGFLSSLGSKFLSQIYTAIDQSEECFIIVEANGPRIVGFVSGGEGLISIFKILLRHPFRLFSSLFPQLFNWKIFARIIIILFKILTAENTKQKLPSNELFSIAVDPKYRRSGVAQLLYNNFCEEFTKRGINEFKIFVGSELRAANSFYSKMGAIAISQTKSHDSKKSIFYSHKLSIRGET